MEVTTFKEKNFITVPGFAVVKLRLSGNELLCYSLIYGFTQDGETEFRGSLTYIASALNVTRQNAKKIIDRLVERGLVERKEIIFSGVKFCHYIAKSNGVAESATPYNNEGNGVAESATNDNIIINYKDNNIAADGGLFPDMPVNEPKPKGTAERQCLFANSRFNDYEAFAACFQAPEFANIDIAYYYNAVADWSAQKGKMMKDWIATARNFMRSDMERKKLHCVNSGFDYEAAKAYLDI